MCSVVVAVDKKEIGEEEEGKEEDEGWRRCRWFTTDSHCENFYFSTTPYLNSGTIAHDSAKTPAPRCSENQTC